MITDDSMEVRLFFEFLQVAIGYRKSLSLSVADADWHRLFEFCKRQALIGVGFTAVAFSLCARTVP